MRTRVGAGKGETSASLIDERRSILGDSFANSTERRCVRLALPCRKLEDRGNFKEGRRKTRLNNRVIRDGR